MSWDFILKEKKMKFVFKVWVLTVEIDLFDLDVQDGNIQISVKIGWK